MRSVLIPFAAVLVAAGTARADASCHIAGDSIALGLSRSLGGCTRDAEIGIPAAAVVARSTSGGSSDYLVVSAGSNDFPRGLPAAGFARVRAGIETALSRIHAARGRAEMIVVLPANGARPVVAAWAASHGVRAIGFAPGRDGIHPKSYSALAEAVLKAMASAGS